MPFLGSQPVDQYQSLAKQTITGDGSTAYTLNRSVTNAYDMEVFINNVRQEPDTSYSASGNTITFTAAVTASDSCYLIYQGQAVGSINPPANSVGGSQIQNTSVTTAHLHTDVLGPMTVDAANSSVNIGGRFQVGDSSITQAYPQANLGYVLDVQASTGGQTYISIAEPGASSLGDNGMIIGEDTTNSWIVQRGNKGMNFSTNDLSRMLIDGSGNIVTPYQPGVNVTPASTESGTYNSTTNANQYCIWSSVRWQVGNSYNTSNGTFTAPITGKYYVSFHSNWHNSGAGSWIMPQVYKNGSVYEQWYHSTAGHGSWIQIQGVTIVDCAQNDTIRLYKQTQSGSGGGTDLGNYTSLVIRLVG